MNNIIEPQWKGADPKITLYRVLRSVGETIQLYEDVNKNTYIKIGNFFCQIEIDDDGHLATMLGDKHLDQNVEVQWKKAGSKPRAHA
ncbi:hypothetical protein F4Z99_09465 [Candidatus Poribacteria bacterium]|nr:hypothetical protein [Candidatus Poribacteria bacterium]MYB01457.1 hypothetical protein [Candidatus Poribacteria bacterium]